MLSIDEKRVYADREGAIEAFVAAGTGVCRVRVAAEMVGEFDLVSREPARDLAGGPGTLAVATDEDVLVADPVHDAEPTFEPTGFGPAVAVGYADGRPIAAGPDGRLAGHDGGWEELAALEGTVTAIDGELIATDEGLFRLRGTTLRNAGLTAVRDVSTPGVPLAATDDGLYRLGNGWLCDREGPFDVVAADPRSEPGRLERAHAAAGHTLYALADGEWGECLEVGAPIADVAYGETVYAVTADGTFLAGDGDGWRSRHLGIRDVVGCSVPARG